MLYTCLTPGVDGVQFSEGGLPQRLPRRRRASLGLGSRKITVDDGTIGVFRQAWIDGGGGEGEPAAYTLPALVKGDRIIADFSVPPKNAPPKYTNFKGKRTEQGIEWEDGNVWPCGGHKHQD